MRKVIRKWFWVWDFDKEEKWLNEMADKGLVLVAVGWCRYEFEDCVPGEYKICLDFLENKCSRVENEKYIAFLEETGADHSLYRAAWRFTNICISIMMDLSGKIGRAGIDYV